VWALLLAACGGAPAPSIDVADSCVSPQGWTVERQAGTNSSCQFILAIVDGSQAEFEAKWGPVDLKGWTIRLRTGQSAPGHLGMTYYTERIIDVSDGSLNVLFHELRHAQLGPSSDGHPGWCGAFTDWEKYEAGLNDDAYLGCH